MSYGIHDEFFATPSGAIFAGAALNSSLVEHLTLAGLMILLGRAFLDMDKLPKRCRRHGRSKLPLLHGTPLLGSCLK